MATDREARLAANEAVFRAVNERMAEWAESHEDGVREPYACECADPECRERVPLRKVEYEHVRSDSTWFFVLPGHEIEGVETVIEQHDGWSLIQKDPVVRDVVRELDRRSE